MQGNTKRRIFRWVLVGVCLVLATRLFLATAPTPGESIYSGAAMGHPAVIAESADAPVEGEVSVVDAAVLDEIVSRPLFTESRRPYIAPVVDEPAPRLRPPPPPPPVMPQEKFLLSGVVIASGKKIALLRVDTQNVVQRLTLGDTLVGWTVDEIKDHAVTMSKGEQVQNVELEIKKALPAPLGGGTGISVGSPQTGAEQATNPNAPNPPPPPPAR